MNRIKNFIFSRVWLLLILLGINGSLSYARQTYIESDGKKAGVLDEDGNVIIPIAYDNVEPWGNLYRVEKKEKFGLYDEAGNEVLPVKYTQISNLNKYGRAVVCEKGKVIASNNGRKYVNKGKFGILNDKGKILVPCEYEDFYEFVYPGSDFKFSKEGMCVSGGGIYFDDTLQTECKYVAFGGSKHEKGIRQYYGVIDVDKGQVVVPANKFVFTFLPSNGLARYYSKTSNNWSFGYWNLDSQTGFEAATGSGDLFTFTYWTHGDFCGDVAPVNGSDGWKFFNRAGEVVRSGYKSIRHGSAVRMWMTLGQDSTMTVFDEDAKDIPVFSGYMNIIFPGKQWETPVFPVENKDRRWGVINLQGDVVVPFEYQDMSLADLPFIGVKKKGNWGLITPQREELAPCAYATVRYPIELQPKHVWCMKADSLWFSVDTKTHKEYGSGFESVETFRDGLAWAKPNGLDVKPDWFSNTLTGRKMDDKSNFKRFVWGIIVNETCEVLFPEPVNWYYRDYAKASVKKKGRALRPGEAHAALMKLVSPNLNYYMNTTLNENEWDY